MQKTKEKEKQNDKRGLVAWMMKKKEKRKERGIDDFLSQYRIALAREAEKKTSYEAHYVEVLVKTRVKRVKALHRARGNVRRALI